MSILDLVALLLTLSALFGWVNRKLALPPHTIGLLVMGVLASLALPPPSVPLLVWAGVRGGIPIALSLSIPDSSAKPAILTCTYAVVLFSIAVQGASLGAVARRTVEA